MGCGSSSENGATEPTKASKGPSKNHSPTKVNGNAKNGNSKPDVPHTFQARYNKGKQLGEGAFSAAFEVTSKIDGGKYACKVTEKKKLEHEDDILAITSEIAILKKLNHPSIVRCHDNFEDDQCFYVILDYMQGGELFDRIVAKASYNEAEARAAFITITRGIKFLHDNNIVHRDLKPENLLMENATDDTKVKIADFGFAKIANGSSLSTMCGSPGYVAPEILNRKKYGAPVDMWAMGVIAFILLGGYSPFPDDGNQNKMFDKIKKAEYSFDPDYWGHVSKQAKDLIRGLLTIDPTKRLTADQALTHPWVGVSVEELSRINLDANLQELKKFNANRKFKAAAKAVIAINKMNRLIGKAPSTSDKSPPMTPNPAASR